GTGASRSAVQRGDPRSASLAPLASPSFPEWAAGRIGSVPSVRQARPSVADGRFGAWGDAQATARGPIRTPRGPIRDRPGPRFAGRFGRRQRLALAASAPEPADEGPDSPADLQHLASP